MVSCGKSESNSESRGQDRVELMTPASEEIPIVGGTIIIHFMTSGPWSVLPNSSEWISWYDIFPLSGNTTDSKITVMAGLNSSGISRQGAIRIICGTANAEVVIIQDSEGFSTEIDVPRYLDSEW